MYTNYIYIGLLILISMPFFFTVNRRLDEWVKLDQLDLNSVETVVDEKVEDKVTFSTFLFIILLFQIPAFIFRFCSCAFQVTSLKMTRHQKRKIDETHVEVCCLPFPLLHKYSIICTSDVCLLPYFVIIIRIIVSIHTSYHILFPTVSFG